MSHLLLHVLTTMGQWLNALNLRGMANNVTRTTIAQIGSAQI